MPQVRRQSVAPAGFGGARRRASWSARRPRRASSAPTSQGPPRPQKKTARTKAAHYSQGRGTAERRPTTARASPRPAASSSHAPRRRAPPLTRHPRLTPVAPAPTRAPSHPAARTQPQAARASQETPPTDPSRPARCRFIFLNNFKEKSAPFTVLCVYSPEQRSKNLHAVLAQRGALAASLLPPKHPSPRASAQAPTRQPVRRAFEPRAIP